MCWWSTGTEGVNAPTISETCGAHIPQAFTTSSVSIGPASVSTAVTSPDGPSRIPVTRRPVSIRAPSSRAALASAWVAMCGSTEPSSSIQIAPWSDSRAAAGSRRTTSSGESTSTSRPIPRARLAPRSSSSRLSGLEAMRRLPTVSKTPSSR